MLDVVLDSKTNEVILVIDNGKVCTFGDKQFSIMHFDNGASPCFLRDPADNKVYVKMNTIMLENGRYNK